MTHTNVQFAEHKSGNKSNAPAIQKLDKLARNLKIKIHIDGVAYGAESPLVATKSTEEAYAEFIKDEADQKFKETFESAKGTVPDDIDLDMETGQKAYTLENAPDDVIEELMDGLEKVIEDNTPVTNEGSDDADAETKPKKNSKKQKEVSEEE